MKSFKFILFFACIIMIKSCKAQKNLLIKQVNEAGSNQALEDSVINTLRADNDIVIAYAVENFAWARTINYLIVTQKNNQWNGYAYNVSLMKQNTSQIINPTAINKVACISLVDYIMQTKAWLIKGDNGTNFCTDGSNKCNINDASSARLWIITKKTVINPSYYAPEFYQQCCYDKDRALFLTIKNKIETIARVEQSIKNDN